MQQEKLPYSEIQRCFVGRECFIRRVQLLLLAVFAIHFRARMVELVDTQDLKS